MIVFSAVHVAKKEGGLAESGPAEGGGGSSGGGCPAEGRGVLERANEKKKRNQKTKPKWYKPNQIWFQREEPNTPLVSKGLNKFEPESGCFVLIFKSTFKPTFKSN